MLHPAEPGHLDNHRSFGNHGNPSTLCHHGSQNRNEGKVFHKAILPFLHHSLQKAERSDSHWCTGSSVQRQKSFGCKEDIRKLLWLEIRAITWKKAYMLKLNDWRGLNWIKFEEKHLVKSDEHQGRHHCIYCSAKSFMHFVHFNRRR